MAVIEVKNLTKTFENGVTALNDVNLSVAEGDIFGIIGLSGAGKSTLVRCMNMLERPTSGTVELDGTDITSLDRRGLSAARHQIGMIFQSFNLMEQRTARENVMFPLKLKKLPRAEAGEIADRLLERVGLGDRKSAYPSQLSGGQKQRVAIARALALSPRVLLCDEATSALDPQTTLSILSLIKELNREMGLTVVIITHEMRVIESICNRVAIIEDSEIREQGMVSDVFLNPKTAAAKRLICPGGTPDFGGGRRIRIVFDGTKTDRPIIADMVLQCSAPVNIAYADTKEIDGRQYGHMIITLPADDEIAERMVKYLEREKINYEEA